MASLSTSIKSESFLCYKCLFVGLTQQLKILYNNLKKWVPCIYVSSVFLAGPFLFAEAVDGDDGVLHYLLVVEG